MEIPKKKIVILGGGFAGLVTVRRLLAMGLDHLAEITIIDRSTMHVYSPWVYEVCSGFLSRKDTNVERDELIVPASFPFSHFPQLERVRFREGKVERIDAARKIVFLEDGLAVHYDALLISLGTEPNYFGIPGLPENCTPLKWIKDARVIDEKVCRLVKSLVPHERKQIVVAGGGPNGLELAGELMTSVRALEARKEIASGVVKVMLIDRGQILSVFPPILRKLTLRRLKNLGVEVRESVAVTEVTVDRVKIKNEQGDAMEVLSDLCVWSGGIMPASATKDMPFSHEPKGRLIVDETFRVIDADGVFAAGDCSFMRNERGDRMDPQTAEVAIAQAKVAARNIAHYLKGEKLEHFRQRKSWNILISLGGKYAVGRIFGVTVYGYLAHLIRRLVDFRYFALILPPLAALRKWRRGVILYAKNDN